jgi:hypothetical protein
MFVPSLILVGFAPSAYYRPVLVVERDVREIAFRHEKAVAADTFALSGGVSHVVTHPASMTTGVYHSPHRIQPVSLERVKPGITPGVLRFGRFPGIAAD